MEGGCGGWVSVIELGAEVGCFPPQRSRPGANVLVFVPVEMLETSRHVSHKPLPHLHQAPPPTTLLTPAGLPFLHTHTHRLAHKHKRAHAGRTPAECLSPRLLASTPGATEGQTAICRRLGPARLARPSSARLGSACLGGNRRARRFTLLFFCQLEPRGAWARRWADFVAMIESLFAFSSFNMIVMLVTLDKDFFFRQITSVPIIFRLLATIRTSPRVQRSVLRPSAQEESREPHKRTKKKATMQHQQSYLQ